MNLLGQYPYTMQQNHPRALSNGAVYCHILAAEHKLGRALKPEEVVHHINEDKIDYSEDNLLIFVNQNAHASFHARGLSLEDLIEVEPNVFTVEEKRCTCQYCKKEISRGAATCVDCFNIYRNRKIKERPTKDELLNILTSKRGCFAEVGRIYDVSDNAIRKWCKTYQLPYHSKDYQ